MEVVSRPSTFQTHCQSLLTFLRDPVKTEQLYGHQVEAVLQLHKYFDPLNITVNPDRNTIALVVLPTGCGKTGVAVLASYALNATRVLVITPSMTISEQIRGDYQTFLIKRGVIKQEQAEHVIPSISLIKSTDEIQHGYTSEVMITNIHKVGGKSPVSVSEFPTNYDLVIVDEAHHYPAPTWRQFVDHFPRSKRLFLTATPLHNGEKILRKKFFCYTLLRQQAVMNGIIRGIDDLDELPYNKNQSQLPDIYWVSVVFEVGGAFAHPKTSIVFVSISVKPCILHIENMHKIELFEKYPRFN